MSMEIHCKSPEDLIKEINRLTSVFPDGVKQALWEQANAIMNDSSEQVPVDYGYLRASRYVNDPYSEMNKIGIELGYWANYAAAVHGIPEPPMKSEGGRSAHHEEGKWHFLKDPIDAHAPELNGRIVLRVEQMLGGEL
jgi:hypothetical protein